MCRNKRFFSFLAALLAGIMLFTVVGSAADIMCYTRLLKRVEPKIQTAVVTGQTVTLRALADKDAEVYASVDSGQVRLTRTKKTSGLYFWFEGEYEVPQNLAEGTDLGTIIFTAVKKGVSERMAAPGFVVLEAALQGSKSFTAVSGQRVSVTSEYADVFTDVDRGEDYAAPYYFELPRGTIDYIASVGSNTYTLKSGRKVLHSDVKLLNSTESMGNNAITAISATADESFTTLTITNKWNVPFNIETAPFTYKDYTNAVSSYDATKVIITFDYTTAMQAGSFSLPANGAFTKAEWKTTSKNGIPQLVLTLTLAEKGKYYGCYAEYVNGKLTLRFYNPIDDLADARIVIDPGHGDFGGVNPDCGAIQQGYYESDLNLAKALALKAALEARGAEVYLLDSKNTDLRSLYDRVDLARAWEPHIMVSVHHNSTASTTTNASGCEVYYNSPFAMPLADAISDGVYSAYKELGSSTAVNRGDKFSEFCVTRVKQFAAVLIEYGYMNNPDALKILVNEDNLEVFAENTADALAEYFK